MRRFVSVLFSFSAALWILAFAVAFAAFSAETPPVLVVGEAGANLYARQDIESDIIARLDRGEELTPIAHAVGAVTWYLVRTKDDAIGWVRSVDVAASDQAQSVFKDPTPSQLSTWVAATKTGRTFGGTWTVQVDASTGEASGIWTLRDAMGKTILRGTWVASKFSTGWNGVWRAFVDGQSNEYSGSWTAAVQLPREARFAELFEAAARDAVRGLWAAGRHSGSWSIRAAE